MTTRFYDTPAPILVTGTGRSGTTVLAEVVSLQPGILHVEEPNFITDLILPYVSGTIEREQFLGGLEVEGWRGPMKVCRTLSEMYPDVFADEGRLPIRPYMRSRFQEILDQETLFPGRDGTKAVSEILGRIIKETCAAAERTVWLVKQPSAILRWQELREFWPHMKIIHVARRLGYVVQSRLKRGYQTTFQDAMAVCESRLWAAAEACRVLPADLFMTIRIEDLASSPRKAIDQVFAFLNLAPTSNVYSAAESIDEAVLYGLGDPREFFSVSEKRTIEALRETLNRRFGQEVV